MRFTRKHDPDLPHEDADFMYVQLGHLRLMRARIERAIAIAPVEGVTAEQIDELLGTLEQRAHEWIACYRQSEGFFE